MLWFAISLVVWLVLWAIGIWLEFHLDNVRITYRQALSYLFYLPLAVVFFVVIIAPFSFIGEKIGSFAFWDKPIFPEKRKS